MRQLKEKQRCASSRPTMAKSEGRHGKPRGSSDTPRSVFVNQPQRSSSAGPQPCSPDSSRSCFEGGTAAECATPASGLTFASLSLSDLQLQTTSSGLYDQFWCSDAFHDVIHRVSVLDCRCRVCPYDRKSSIALGGMGPHLGHGRLAQRICTHVLRRAELD